MQWVKNCIFRGVEGYILLGRGVQKQTLNQEVSFPDLFILPEIVNGPVVTDHTVVDDVSPIAESQGHFLILLGQENRQVFVLQASDLILEHVDHDWGQA